MWDKFSFVLKKHKLNLLVRHCTIFCRLNIGYPGTIISIYQRLQWTFPQRSLILNTGECTLNSLNIETPTTIIFPLRQMENYFPFVSEGKSMFLGVSIFRRLGYTFWCMLVLFNTCTVFLIFIYLFFFFC